MILGKFAILEPDRRSGLLATWNESVALDGIKCELNPGHQRAGRRLTALSIEVPPLALAQDFVWTWQGDCLVSEGIADLFHREGFTGFKTQPAEVTSKGQVIDHRFMELVVTGWGGVAREESGVCLVESCPSCGLLLYRPPISYDQMIDSERWDGSDFFRVWPLPRYIMMTTRLTRALTSRKLTGFSTTSAAAKRIEGDEISPGRVSYWLPREESERLNISIDIL